MKPYLYSARAYLRFLLNSRSRHSVHSPFVYTLINEVFKNKTEHPAFLKINELRNTLSRSSRMIEITDFGVGRKTKDYSNRFESLATIVRSSAISEKYGRMVFHLLEYFKPSTIIELGTSVGVSTLYLALSNPDARVITAEGCTSKSEQAASNFIALQATNIKQHIGRFDLVLPDIVRQAGKLDFAYIDGNHTYDATVKYFDSLLDIAHNDTIFVFDDIHWSKEMEKAWNEITDHKRVTVSIDLFRMGIIFLRSELSKQKFVIRL